MTRNFKTWLKWGVALLVAAVLIAGLVRTLATKKTQQTAAAALAAKPAQSLVELVQSDLVQVKTRELSQGLAISGTLKASNSAFIKARVAGELLDLKVREGDPVKAGQIVAKVDPTESNWRIKQAQEQADAAKAQIAIAQRQFDNNRSLVDQGFISRTSLDTSSAQLLGAQATYKAAQVQVELAKKGLDDTILRSPIAGLVAQRLAQPGERVAVDARVLEVVDLSRIELEASISAADSLNVKIGQSATLQIEGTARPLLATVARINPSAQSGSRSVLAYLTISQGSPVAGDSAGSLRQGLYAQGVLGTGTLDALTLPVSAIRTDKPEPYVQLVEQGKVRHRNIQPGLRGESGGESMVAVSGLAENDNVVRGSVGQLREGTLVKFTANAAATAAAAPASASSAPAR